MTRRLCIDKLRASAREQPAAEEDRSRRCRGHCGIAGGGPHGPRSDGRAPEHCQEILDRFFARDESYSTIGEALELPSGTIASRISRCLGGCASSSREETSPTQRLVQDEQLRGRAPGRLIRALPPAPRRGCRRRRSFRSRDAARRDRRAGSRGRRVPRSSSRGPRDRAHLGRRHELRPRSPKRCVPASPSSIRRRLPLDGSVRPRLARGARRDRRAYSGSRGGARLGHVTAMAAGLIASAARRSPTWEEGRGVSAQAQALRSRVEKLAEANEEAYLEALALIEGAEEEGTRDAAIGKALDTAAELRSRSRSAHTTWLCSAARPHNIGSGRRRGRLCCLLLAEAAARAAAGLVAANLVSMPGDERVAHAQRLAEAATVAAKRAVAASASR